ncbi:DNA topoisomerase VI subunit B [Candidatus Woesearchaeota archaeon]|nr:DNA topoisomerase VI subunit B [Candidatus Woesearchaeota archaeon]
MMAKKKQKKRTKVDAKTLAKKQREISVAEFFQKNRHLLGFDNKKKALLTTIKEAVDNSLDACEEAGILPEINVEIIDMNKKQGMKKEISEQQTTLVTEEIKEEDSGSKDRFRVIIEDNGPGIVKKQIPKIFAKLLYGSKFHTLKMSRGQQGIGISAAVLYGQLTTGRPTRIMSKTDAKSKANYYELKVDTRTNEPNIMAEKTVEWNKEHGIRIEIDLEATYQKAGQSVDNYLKQTAVVNPHVTLIYTSPDAEQRVFPRVIEDVPEETREIRPHPYGVEVGMLMEMLGTTEARTLQSFLMKDFSRVGAGTAKNICENAGLLPKVKPKKVTREMTEKLNKGIQKTRISSPPTDCIAPIGAEELEKGLKKEIKAEFYTSITRPPAVYRGNPFIVEAGIAFGGEQNSENSVRLLRFANRVPLLYQQNSCATAQSVMKTNWRSYGLSQSRNSLPIGPATIVIHIASVWVPFTSESKEAIAHYPEIIKEIKLALQECGRKLASYVNKKKRIVAEGKKRDYIETYIPHVAEALKGLLGLNEKDEKNIQGMLKSLLEKQRGKLEQIKVEASEFDESYALADTEEE